MPDNQEAESPEQVVEQAATKFPEYREQAFALFDRILEIPSSEEIPQLRAELDNQLEGIRQQIALLSSILTDLGLNTSLTEQATRLKLQYETLGDLYVIPLLKVPRSTKEKEYVEKRPPQERDGLAGLA